MGAPIDWRAWALGVSLVLGIASGADHAARAEGGAVGGVDPDRLGEPVTLFGGESLDGWKAFLRGDAAKEDVWSVRDGVLRCEPNAVGYLRYNERKFKNFVLSMEWRFRKPGNTGVLLRCLGEPHAFGVWPRSIEAQIHENMTGDIWNIGEFPMKTAPKRTSGRRTEKIRPSNEKPVGEWNRYVLVLDGGTLRLIVNGVVQNRARECLEKAGWVALQSERAVVEFRDIVVRPIVEP